MTEQAVRDERPIVRHLTGWAVWAGLSLLIILLHLVPGFPSLRYDRAAVSAGEVWRLISGHLVHVDGQHLAVNLAGLWMLLALFHRQLPALASLVFIACSIIAVDAGLYWLAPEVDWYVGLSGVLHGIWAGAALSAWTTDRLLCGGALGLLAAKLSYEQLVGPLPLSGTEVIFDAHLFGACGGLIGAFALRARASLRQQSV